MFASNFLSIILHLFQHHHEQYFRECWYGFYVALVPLTFNKDKRWFQSMCVSHMTVWSNLFSVCILKIWIYIWECVRVSSSALSLSQDHRRPWGQVLALPFPRVLALAWAHPASEVLAVINLSSPFLSLHS